MIHRPASIAVIATWMTVSTGLVACGSRSAPQVAAVVEGSPIKGSDTAALIETFVGRDEGKTLLKELGRRELARSVLSFEIKIRLLDKLAEELGVSVPSDPGEQIYGDLLDERSYRELGLRREDLIQGVRAGRLSQAISEKLFPGVPVSDSDVEDEYHRKEPVLEKLWKASAEVGVFANAAGAQEVRRRVQDGEAFGPAAAAAGATHSADIEITSITPLPHQLVEAAGRLTPGQVSDPIEIAGAWVSLSVKRREDLSKPGIDAVKPDLIAVVKSSKRRSLFSEWFEKKLASARITVDGYYGHWNASSKTVE